MPDRIVEVATTLFERLRTLAVRDDDLRGVLRALGEALLAVTEEPSTLPEAPPTTDTVPAPLELSDTPTTDHTEDATPAPPAPGSNHLDRVAPAPLHLELTLGRSGPMGGDASIPPRPAYRPPTDSDDLPEIEARCRMKAEGARWTVARRRQLDAGADFRAEIAPKDRDIIERAKAVPDCYLWMNSPEWPLPNDLTRVEDVARCFEAVADGVGLIRGLLDDIENNQDVFEEALKLVAEAQSALRVAIGRVDPSRHDPDQFKVYDWLRTTAGERQIYIRRYMRIDDPADPSRLGEVHARIADLRARSDRFRQRSKRYHKNLNRIRYHAKLIAEARGTPKDPHHDWRTIAQVVDEMVGDGLPPSNRELRDLLLPILDDLPEFDGFPRSFELVLQEVDRYLATRPSDSETTTLERPSPEVQEAAQLLGGKTIVLIGGDRRPDAQESLKTELGLADLVWIETREHQSIESFEPVIARPEVALVLLAIRWSSHAFGDVKQFCDRYGKPLVRLPAGYNPNQVAFQVLSQCSTQLKAEA